MTDIPLTGPADGSLGTPPGAPDPLPDITAARRARRTRPSVWSVLRQDKIGAISTLIVLLVIFIAVFGPMIAPHDPNDQILTATLRPPVWSNGGSAAHLLGTDQLGRDVFSQLLVGARYTMMIAVGAVILEGLIGIAIGLLAGYFGGWVDAICMRWCDIQMGFPGLLVVLLILLLAGPSPTTLIFAFAVNNWMIFARMIRSDVSRLKTEPYVDAARVTGMKGWRLTRRHILPHLTQRVVAVALIELPRLVLAESATSFLGLGVQPPNWSWGLMIGQSRNLIPVAYWLGVFTGLAIVITVLSLHFFARMIEPLIDPSSSTRNFLSR
jgi:ABC-type dipeptide/oligopeptide/nickel transport system permease subunit